MFVVVLLHVSLEGVGETEEEMVSVTRIKT